MICFRKEKILFYQSTIHTGLFRLIHRKGITFRERSFEKKILLRKEKAQWLHSFWKREHRFHGGEQGSPPLFSTFLMHGDGNSLRAAN